MASDRSRSKSGNRSLSHLLDALLADGLTYRAFEHRLHCWSGICPLCRRGTLRIWVEGDQDLDDWEFVEKGQIKVKCMGPCNASKIRGYLYRDLKDIRYERTIRELRAHLAWSIDSYRRYVENH